MVAFILGLLIGAFIGMTVMSLCVIAKQSDERHIIDAHVADVEDSTPGGKD